jgi:CcmD family protein
MNDTTQATVADRSQEFLPVEGSQETSSAGGLLVAAYAIMWVLVFAFIWLTSRRLHGMNGRISQLESALRHADTKATVQGASQQPS